MPVKLKTLGVHPKEMRDGQIAEIVKHPVKPTTGRIIQRCGDAFIVLGMDKRNSFPKLSETPPGSVLVRILQEGETITVYNNQ